MSNFIKKITNCLEKPVEIIGTLLTVIISLFALSFSWQAFQTARESNVIASDANNIALGRSRDLPTIECAIR